MAVLLDARLIWFVRRGWRFIVCPSCVITPQIRFKSLKLSNHSWVSLLGCLNDSSVAAFASTALKLASNAWVVGSHFLLGLTGAKPPPNEATTMSPKEAHDLEVDGRGM